MGVRVNSNYPPAEEGFRFNNLPFRGFKFLNGGDNRVR